MTFAWGVATAVVGLLIFLAAEFRSELGIYQWMHGLARKVFPNYARAFWLSVGALMLLGGIFWAGFLG